MEKARSFPKTHGDQTYLEQAVCPEMEDKAFPGRGKKEESKWDMPAPGGEGAEAQGRDPRIHGHPLGRGRQLKQLGSELANL